MQVAKMKCFFPVRANGGSGPQETLGLERNLLTPPAFLYQLYHVCEEKSKVLPDHRFTWKHWGKSPSVLTPLLASLRAHQFWFPSCIWHWSLKVWHRVTQQQWQLIYVALKSDKEVGEEHGNKRKRREEELVGSTGCTREGRDQEEGRGAAITKCQEGQSF